MERERERERKRERERGEREREKEREREREREREGEREREEERRERARRCVGRGACLTYVWQAKASEVIGRHFRRPELFHQTKSVCHTRLPMFPEDRKMSSTVSKK